jgi:hypothetical protein
MLKIALVAYTALVATLCSRIILGRTWKKMVGFIPNMAMMFGLFWAVFSKILPSSPGIYIIKASSE